MTVRAPRKKASPRKPGSWLLPVLAVLFVAAAGGVWWWTQQPLPVLRVKDLELSKQAVNRAGALLKQKRLREAQSEYRSALALAPEDYWQLHYVLAGTAAQISVENTSRAGISQPYAVSCVERVACMREALLEYERAEQLADTPQALATIFGTRAETYYTWGQAWDALRDFEAAALADTTDPKRAERAARMALSLSHP